MIRFTNPVVVYFKKYFFCNLTCIFNFKPRLLNQIQKEFFEFFLFIYPDFNPTFIQSSYVRNKNWIVNLK